MLHDSPWSRWLHLYHVSLGPGCFDRIEDGGTSIFLETDPPRHVSCVMETESEEAGTQWGA